MVVFTSWLAHVDAGLYSFSWLITRWEWGLRVTISSHLLKLVAIQYNYTFVVSTLSPSLHVLVLLYHNLFFQIGLEIYKDLTF